MTNTLLRYCRIALLLTAVTFAASLPRLVMAQDPAPISAEAQKRILSDPGVPPLGAAHADVTVVEYFDFNCPYCRKLAPSFPVLVAKDHSVAVIYKDWPIFGGVSVYAAREALAANWQGKYLEAHDALIYAPRLAEDGQVDEALRRAGIDMPRLKKDLETHRGAIDALLARNDSEARALGFRGTPGIMVGRLPAFSVANLADLQSEVSSARHIR